VALRPDYDLHRTASNQVRRVRASWRAPYRCPPPLAARWPQAATAHAARRHCRAPRWAQHLEDRAACWHSKHGETKPPMDTPRQGERMPSRISREPSAAQKRPTSTCPTASATRLVIEPMRATPHSRRLVSILAGRWIGSPSCRRSTGRDGKHGAWTRGAPVPPRCGRRVHPLSEALRSSPRMPRWPPRNDSGLCRHLQSAGCAGLQVMSCASCVSGRQESWRAFAHR
jgi:hypothetical protein